MATEMMPTIRHQTIPVGRSKNWNKRPRSGLWIVEPLRAGTLKPPNPRARSEGPYTQTLEGPRHPPGAFLSILPEPRRCGMPSPEEYRQRAKEARDQANEFHNEWERQGLLIIADQYERLAAYKDLTARPSGVTAPARANLEETATPPASTEAK